LKMSIKFFMAKLLLIIGFENILKVNNDFLGKLETIIKEKENCESDVSLLFLEYSNLDQENGLTFKVYEDFIINYNYSNSLLTKLTKENEKFHAWLSSVFNDLTNSKYRIQKIGSFLITPIQRLI
jgi:hypothetical protein